MLQGRRLSKIVFAFALMLPAPALAALEITTYGDAKLIKPVFEGLSAFASSGSWTSFVQLISLIALLAIGMYVVFNPSPGADGRNVISDFVKMMTIGLICGGFFHFPGDKGVISGILTENVQIVDAYTGQTYYVSNVPIGAAYPAWIVNNVAKGLADIFSKYFGSNVAYFNPQQAGIDDLSLIPERLESLRFPICQGSGCDAYDRWRGDMKEFITNCVLPYFSRCEAGEIVDCCGIDTNMNVSTLFREGYSSGGSLTKTTQMRPHFLGMSATSESEEKCFLDPNEYIGSRSCAQLYQDISDNWGGIKNKFKELALRQIIPDYQSTVFNNREDVFRTYLTDIVGITHPELDNTYGGIAEFLLSTVIVNEMRLYSPSTDADYARAISYATAGHTAMTWRIIGRQVMSFVEATAYALSPLLIVLSMIPGIGTATWGAFVGLLVYVAFQFPLAELLTGLAVKKLITAYSEHISTGDVLPFYKLYIEIIKVGRQNGITTAYLMTASPALAGLIGFLTFKLSASSYGAAFQGGGAESASSRTSAQTALSQYYSSTSPELAQARVEAEAAYTHRQAMSPQMVADILQSRATAYDQPEVSRAYVRYQSTMAGLGYSAKKEALSRPDVAHTAQKAFVQEQAARLGVSPEVFSESLHKSASDTSFWADVYQSYGREGLFKSAFYRFLPESRQHFLSALRAADSGFARKVESFMRGHSSDEGIRQLFYDSVKAEATSLAQGYMLSKVFGDERKAGEFRNTLGRLTRLARTMHMEDAVTAGTRQVKLDDISIASPDEARKWEHALGLESGTLKAGDNIRAHLAYDPDESFITTSFVFSRHGREMFRRALEKQVLDRRTLAGTLKEEEKGQLEMLARTLPLYPEGSKKRRLIERARSIVDDIAESGMVTGGQLLALHNIAQSLRKLGIKKDIADSFDYTTPYSVLDKFAPVARWQQIKNSIHEMILNADDRAWADQMRRNLVEIDKALASGQAVELTLHRDADTGKIALIEAEYGGKVAQFAERKSDVRDVSSLPVLVQGRLFYAQAVRDQYGRLVKYTAEGQIDGTRPLVFKDTSGREHTLTGGKISAVLDSDQRLSSAIVKDAIMDGKRYSGEIHFGDDLGKAVWMRAERGIVEKEEADIAPYQSTPQTARAFMEGYSSAAYAYTQQAEEHGDAALRYQAVMATKAVEDFFKQTGIIQTDTNVSGSGGLKVSPSTTIGRLILKGLLGVDPEVKAGLKLSRENLERLQHDLIYYSIRNIQNQALEAATVGGKTDWNMFREIYQGEMQKFWTNINALAEGKDPSQFGASAILGEPWAKLKEYYHEFKGDLEKAYSEWKKDMNEEAQRIGQAIKNRDADTVQEELLLTKQQAEEMINTFHQAENTGQYDNEK